MTSKIKGKRDILVKNKGIIKKITPLAKVGFWMEIDKIKFSLSLFVV